MGAKVCGISPTSTTDIAASGMVTPGQRYRCEDAEVLRRRRETMSLEARRNHLSADRDSVLNCTPIGRVWLQLRKWTA